MARRNKLRLAQGAFEHRPCADCEQPLPQKQYVEPGRRWIFRRRFCHERLVDFSLVLQVTDALVWHDVARFSVAHANNHFIQHYRASKTKHVSTTGELNSEADIERAYQQAVRSAYAQGETYARIWREGPP